MKKIILVVLLFYTGCTLDVELEKSISPEVLSSISGRMFRISVKKSFIFLAEDESVFIMTRGSSSMESVNSLYMLKDGVDDGDIVSFRLEGAHSDNGNYIAVLFHQKNPDKISISVQKNRDQAITAVQFTQDITGESQILEGLVIRSPGMFMLQEFSPIVKPPDYQSYICITDVITATNAIPNLNAIVTIIDRVGGVTRRELDFLTNITATMPIYSFFAVEDLGAGPVQVTRLWGAVVDVKNDRLQILESQIVDNIPTKDQIFTFEQRLREVTSWEYKFSSSL
ncbi:MAG: hypothetical protein ACRCWI_00505 [Brevinema sp.]